MTIPVKRAWSVRVAAGLCLMGLVYLVWTFAAIRAQAGEDEAAPVDAIIVMGAAQYNGAPSPVLRARLEHARKLFEDGYSNIIVTTGGYGPDPNFSEAQVGTQYLGENGVDSSQIITEQGSGSTHDTVLAVSRLMHTHGWTRAIVVSDGFHLYRLKRMFAANGIEALTSPAANSVIESSSTTRFWFSLREVALLTLYRLGQLTGRSE
jgi:uncharacterized SAM-binding protein YcdF (DUF218 family)